MVDERKASTLARNAGLLTAGTLAVLRDAAFAGMVDFHQAIYRLTHQTEFRFTRNLIERVLADFDAAMIHRKRNDTHG